MKKLIYFGASATLLAAAAAALSGGPPTAGSVPSQATHASAGQRVATLSVVNVGCITCAPVVTQALSAVPGVSAVSVTEGFGASASARVVYDPKKVTPAALAAAATNAGYPTEVVQS
ncbi:cation transporter [Sphingopyxis sp. SE2]|uniref:heavy-metal-associated domain-containing protein n=1 Tax=Sphingopyxis sp. SE2 TaxID=1586240 RepID=UPI0028C20EC1|nr:cation transporter [Sphingopyxis sp. SE2]MDT7531285.1 cation transporter [Sphingopyxis sp. SE2]